MATLKDRIQKVQQRAAEQRARMAERDQKRDARNDMKNTGRVLRAPEFKSKEPEAMKQHERLNLREMPRDTIVDKFTTDRSGHEIRDAVLRHKRTYLAAGGVTSMKFFKESVGNNSVSLQTTNLEENGKLPAHQDFVVEFIDVRAFAKAAVEANRLLDLVELLNTGVLQLNYKNKPRFSDGPLVEFVSRTTLVGIDSTTGDAPRSLYRLQNPIALPGGDGWDVDLLWPDGSPALTADVDLDVRLVGQMIEMNRA